MPRLKSAYLHALLPKVCCLLPALWFARLSGNKYYAALDEETINM
eukprot:SAG11_NODE_23247_length_392_cov_0.986348_1_plen_44_part_10